MIEFDFYQTGQRALHFKGAFASGARIALLGSSGAGKTTFLRLLGRIDSAERAELRVDGKSIRQPWQHQATLLHQQPVMFAHHSVQQTLAFALRHQRNGLTLPIAHWARQLGLESLMAQSCAQLSGGQAQRVALLRALATGRRWLLMDEVFAALDPKRVLAACAVVEEYCALTGAGLVLASHQDTPQRYLCNQAYCVDGLVGRMADDLFVALQRQPERPAKSTLIATVDGLENQLLRARLGEQPIYLPVPPNWRAGRCRLTLHADDISLAIGEDHVTSMVNRLRGQITQLQPLGAEIVLVQLDVQQQALTIAISQWSKDRLGLNVGQMVYAEFKLRAVQWHGQVQ